VSGLGRSLLQAGLVLALALPFLAIAGWRARAVRWSVVLLVGALAALDAFLVELPRVGLFRAHHWSWQESLLTLAWPFVLVAMIPGITLASIGVTSRFRPGWLRPSLVAALIAVAVPGVFFALGARKTLSAEGWVYLSLMPGLAEEVAFRGVLQPLLHQAFGRPWRLAGAEFGWGLVITAILFAGFNGLVDVDADLHARIRPLAAIAPLMSSLVSGWVRERTDSVWPCVLGHDLSNLVIPLASLLV
jgi:membrane protease YdiL (CAAX protease family)